jgi:hypothetical protein
MLLNHLQMISIVEHVKEPNLWLLVSTDQLK